MKYKDVFFQRMLLFSIVFITTTTVSLAQISGTVKDANGELLVGVSVIQKGTTKGVVTDVNGHFSIDVAAGVSLKFSSIGYSDLEMPADNNMTVIMSEDAQQIEDVVITGYGGTVSKAKVTSSISSLNKQVLTTGVRSNPAQALAGTIPGLRVSTYSGRPGSTPNIILRGGTEFDGSGSPLIVVDGQVRGSISDINPDDIESMDVLKDAASTSIYGARASNGVILITTKRGKAGHSSIQVKGQVGIGFLNSPYEFVQGEEYISWWRRGAAQVVKQNNPGSTMLYATGGAGTGNRYKDAAGNILDGNYNGTAQYGVMRLDDTNRELLQKGWRVMKDPIPTNATGQYDPTGQHYDLIYSDFDWLKASTNSPSITQDYNVSMSGGNEKGSYYANLGFYNENGFPQKSFYRRFTGVLNGDYQIKKWVKSETNINYVKANWYDGMAQAGEANFWARMLSVPSTFRAYNEKGELVLGRGGADANPLINYDKFTQDNQTDKFTLGQALKFTIIDGLTLRVGAILMYDEGVNEAFTKDFRSGNLSLTDPNAGWDRTRATSAKFDRTLRQTYNAVLNYKTTIAKHHNIDIMLGTEFYDSYNRGLSGSGKLAPTDDFGDLGLTSTEKGDRGVDSWHSRSRIMSYFGRANYDFDSKYLFSFTLRTDGISILRGKNQYGTFPGVSVAWLAHRETFMEPVKDYLSTLKFRLSYGINGNYSTIGTYELQGSMSNVIYDGKISYLLGTLPNEGLLWEQSQTWEPAVELGFFNNRILASVSYYNRLTDKKITNVNLPISSGVSSIRSNNGSLLNHGIEAEINATVMQVKDFKWTAGINGAWNWNKVVSLPFNGNENNRQGGTQIYDPASGKLVWVGGYQEGQEPYQVFGYVSDGIIRTEEDRQNYRKVDVTAGTVQDGSSAGRKVINKELGEQLVREGKMTAEQLAAQYFYTDLGDMKWKDIDKNDTIDFRDRVSLGRTIPRFTGGFNTSLSWKGITLFVRMDFALGHVQRDFMQLWAIGCFQGQFASTSLVRETWTPDNPNAAYPRYMWADQLNQKNFDRPSSMFWRNSNYLAFREVSLSYDLPKIWLEKIKMQGLKITATAQNLGYITDKLLFLPERTGDTNGSYIIPTTLILGATLTF